jgi:hypothetical protein
LKGVGEVRVDKLIRKSKHIGHTVNPEVFQGVEVRLDKMNESLNTELSYIRNEIKKLNFVLLTTQSEVMSRMFQILELLNITTLLELQRVGSSSDGGYYVRPPLSFDNLVSCGIGNEVSFEEDLIKNNFLKHIIAVDGSIQEYPGNRNEVSFIKKYVVDDLSDSESEVTLDELVRGLDSSKKNLLKLDIEGAEAKVINSTPLETLLVFDQILIEMHDLCRIILAKDPLEFNNLINALRKINTKFSPIFVHANNSGQYISLTDFPFPQVIEVTYLKKSSLEEINEFSSIDKIIKLAHCNPNDLRAEDYQIIEKVIK